MNTSEYRKYLPVGLGSGVLLTSAVVQQPVQAQSASDAAAEVSGVITAIGTIAAAAIAVAVAPLAWSMGARIFRRVMQ